MLLTTTSQLDGQQVKAYLGIIGAERYVQIALYRDGSSAANETQLLAVTGGSLQQAFDSQRQALMQRLTQQAEAMGAHAVIGIDFEYTTISESIALITANGTAVTLNPKIKAKSG